MRIVLVLWDDSNVSHGWQLKDCGDDNVVHCQTVGFLQAEDEESITVALSESDCGSVLEKITIPKGCITKVFKMRVR